jgi:hypothetical protein
MLLLRLREADQRVTRCRRHFVDRCQRGGGLAHSSKSSVA